MYDEQDWYEARNASPEIKQTPSPAPEKKQGVGKRAVAFLLSAALVGGAAGFGGAKLADGDRKSVV